MPDMADDEEVSKDYHQEDAMPAPLKVFGLKGFSQRSAAALLGLEVRHVELIVISSSKTKARDMLREAWVNFLVLDIEPTTDELKLQLVSEHGLNHREGIFAFKKDAGPADVIIELLPKGQSALVDWMLSTRV